MASSRLEENLAAIQAKIAERIPTCSFAFGAEHVTAHEQAPPRIVWVRAIDRYEGPARIGGNSRAILGKQTAVIAHCWAKASGSDTEDKAREDLCDCLAWALRVVLGADALPLSAEHLLDQVGAAGRVTLLSFTIGQPVTDTTLPTATVTTIAPDLSGASPTDGVLQCGEP
jgi:hypothetical protein